MHVIWSFRNGEYLDFGLLSCMTTCSLVDVSNILVTSVDNYLADYVMS